ncbi:RND transporter, HAE1/HME family, permease protein [Synechococcus sp. PCC 7335]|nr:RND transporter, HAE1/HME family, permease protein [Synechococcus sp. PCC 7335]
MAVRWRHGTIVLFCLIALFGILALFSLPSELRPGGDRPEVTIQTNYPGASPAEVEDLITRPIEEVLEGVQGVQEMTSSSGNGQSSISLEFAWDVDINQAFVDVLSKLQQADDLPAEASESEVQIVSGDTDSPMLRIHLVPAEGATADLNHYRDLADDVIGPRLRHIEGIGDLSIEGGQAREVEVIVDPRALADRNLAIDDVINTLRSSNRDIRGGPMVVGRREYRVRTVSRANDVKQLEGLILRRDTSGTVYLGDVAEAKIGRATPEMAFLRDGEPAITIGAVRQIGGNVPEISKSIRAALAEIEERFIQQGENVRFIIPYDENDYISQSISFVQSSLIIGAVLAAFVLILFLGSLRTVAVIAITIPTTLISVFIVFALLGRSLNVISLAGLAFASGMIVDNAIVVLENIFTHIQKGKTTVQAAVDATQEVSGAMLASTLTNVAVFMPIVLVEGEAGQLFFDLGIALSASVLFSLFAALTLVPMLSGLFLTQADAQQMLEGKTHIKGNSIEQAIVQVSRYFTQVQSRLEQSLLATVKWSLGKGHRSRRFAVLSVPIALLFVGYQLLPAMDYLPEGNRNLIIWITQPFPGTSIPEAIELYEKPHAFAQAQPEVLGDILVHRPAGSIIGVFLKLEETNARTLSNLEERMRAASGEFPGYRFVGLRRASIFSNPGKEFEVKLIGPDLDYLNQIQGQVAESLEVLDGVQNVRPDFLTGAPELQIVPDRERLAEVSLSALDLGTAVETALGGVRASDFFDGRRDLDVTVKLQDATAETPAQLRQMPLYVGGGGSSQQVQLLDVADMVETTGPNSIGHVDTERAITLTVSLSQEAPLGGLLEQTEETILQPLRATLPSGYRAELAGSANVLSETLRQLGATFLLSLLITYLLLVALYRSLIYPLVIMVTVPIGLTGALLSLAIANLIPGVVVPLDMIAGLGFVILTGIVVNNAILLVDRTLQLQQQGQDLDRSLYEAVRDRLRPIFMSAGTSILGMLPLATFPGKGAELYQGLGIVLVGGLAFSTLLTPTIVPAVMRLLRDFDTLRDHSSDSI